MTGNLPECTTLAVGTLPYTDAELAVEMMIRHNPVCPGWPQLPRIDFREGMYIQFSEGMPGAVVEADRQRIWFDPERAPMEMAEFYEHYLAEDVEYCAISSDYARGLEPFLKRLPIAGAKFTKGQVTGPASLGLTVTDASQKPVLYHDDLFEALVKALACKGRWQAQKFREAAPDQEPVIFFDEPYLTQVGSAMISLSPEQVKGSLNECYAAVDGLTGTHVCGGTDWGILAATDVDILHFDAFEHMQELLIYEKELAAFMERGGMLAWGIVPTGSESFDAGARDLAERIMKAADKIAGFGGGLAAENVLRRSFVSESCGLGSRDEKTAEHCLVLAGEVSDALQSQIC
ncbi:MAG: hypothetical protein M1539_05570 [Actinobacteria bacterium]|nr:hypothetical protein [Actinomycetota bacterium]